MTTPAEDMANEPDHFPQENDQVHLWLKHHRAMYSQGTDCFNGLIDQYLEAAEQGMSLEELVNGRQPEPEFLPMRKKKPLPGNMGD